MTTGQRCATCGHDVSLHSLARGCQRPCGCSAFVASPVAPAEPRCPTCEKPLVKIGYPESNLNREQWEAVRAGDYWCETCPNNGRGRSGAYFWESELAAAPPVEQEAPRARTLDALTDENAPGVCR